MSSPTQSLTGTGAVVTGGASGLGRAITEALAKAGASVALLDADGPAAQAAAAELVESGCDVIGLQCDVTVPDSLAAAMRIAADRFGAFVSCSQTLESPQVLGRARAESHCWSSMTIIGTEFWR
jgi:NAD(P)-dependent dehydrogenase (short-subunit alcohol dehydrogenase family)